MTQPNETNSDPFAQPAAQAPTQDEWAELAELDDDFARAKPAETEDLPDGKYQVRILKAVLDKSQTGNPMLKYDLIVLSGPHTGRHLFKNSVLILAALPYFKADLKVMGMELPHLRDLPNHLPDMLDITLEITKKTKGEYSNVYFNKLLDIPEGGGPVDENTPVAF